MLESVFLTVDERTTMSVPLTSESDACQIDQVGLNLNKNILTWRGFCQQFMVTQVNVCNGHKNGGVCMCV